MKTGCWTNLKLINLKFCLKHHGIKTCKRLHTLRVSKVVEGEISGFMVRQVYYWRQTFILPGREADLAPHAHVGEDNISRPW
jgi:hypothetical protein